MDSSWFYFIEHLQLILKDLKKSNKKIQEQIPDSFSSFNKNIFICNFRIYQNSLIFMHSYLNIFYYQNFLFFIDYLQQDLF